LPDGPALAAARQAVEQSPDRPEPLFRLCCLLLARQDPAANALLPHLERFSGYAPGWQALGQALLPKQPSGPLVAYTRAQAASPSLAAGLGRAAALSLLDRHREAADAYAACERLAPRDARLPHRRGLALRKVGDLQTARTAFAHATVLDPASGLAWHSLGVICQDLGDHAAAAPAFRAALAANPDMHEAAFNLGIALQEGGDLEAALNAYAAALRLRPDLFGRIAQALVSPRVGRLWLSPARLRQDLGSRV